MSGIEGGKGALTLGLTGVFIKRGIGLFKGVRLGVLWIRGVFGLGLDEGVVFYGLDCGVVWISINSKDPFGL